MSIEEIRALKNAEPFQPFVITLRDGRKLHVSHRGVVGWSPSGKVLSVDIGSAFHFVDLPDVAEVEKRPAFRGRAK